MNFLKQLADFAKKSFEKPSAEVMAKRELADAQRALLEAESGQEYAKRMSEYHRDRIRRLTAYMKQEGVNA